ncbi:Scr1 family TA system antitoxin-like transcriptional regulator [Nocardia sp. CC227C]|uniref:Scr1 family TA system antitoxin-like transcriptional regulator n=1 Tax=Nocardia sp. CC227C TaxID=3044562 RepID=UPI00278BBFC7|nr:Scr1 family TA system antitoxin-like transcriptional regulator [Nocardia sp. CC227C]
MSAHTNDLEAAVSAHMVRQWVLHEGTLQIYVLIHEAALRTTLGNDAVMAAQLRHLLRVTFGNVHLVFGVVPLCAGILSPACGGPRQVGDDGRTTGFASGNRFMELGGKLDIG